LDYYSRVEINQENYDIKISSFPGNNWLFKQPSYLLSLPSFMGLHGITAQQLATVTATGKGAMPEV
jgi:hypothetical protein